MRKSLQYQIWNQVNRVRRQIQNQVDEHLWGRIGWQIECQINHQVGLRIRFHLWDQIQGTRSQE